MDEIDKKILHALQEGAFCAPKVTQIGEALKMPPATVYVRIKKMQEAGIIKDYVAVPDPQKVGKNVTIFVVLKINYDTHYRGSKLFNDFLKGLSKIPEVVEIHVCSGSWDYLLKLRVKDTDDYGQLIMNKILPLGGIEKAESYVTYKTFKESSYINM